MPRAALPGIFCLEGEWDPDLRRRQSVLPILELLERLDLARTIHRDVATRDELAFYLAKWGQKRYRDYEVLHLACHGDAGSIQLGRDEMGLEELAALVTGKSQGRVVYFASCLTLGLDEDRLVNFQKQTGAKAVVGYAKEIDWVDSAAFEVLLLDRLLRGNRTDAFFRYLHADHGEFARQLGLVVVGRGGVLTR